MAADLFSRLIQGPAKIGGVLTAPLLEGQEPVRPEDLAEDLLPGGGPGRQQAAELPLGQHGDLGELLPVHTQDLLHGFGDLPEAGDGPDAVPRELRAGCHGDLPAGAPLPVPLVGGIAPDGVLPVPVGEGEDHLRGGGAVRVLGAEHGGIAHLPAGPSEEGEGDGVENGGLARAGVSGDEVEPSGAQQRQVQLRGPRVGAESGQGQLQRSHRSSSRMASKSSAAYRSWTGDRG